MQIQISKRGDSHHRWFDLHDHDKISNIVKSWAELRKTGTKDASILLPSECHLSLALQTSTLQVLKECFEITGCSGSCPICLRRVLSTRVERLLKYRPTDLIVVQLLL